MRNTELSVDNFGDRLISTQNMLVKQWRIRWLHAENIKSIQQCIAGKQFQVKHIFREPNQLARLSRKHGPKSSRQKTSK